jgi:hypothetical protein
MLKFCVSLTTIPSRLKFIYRTLDSIKSQSKLPDKIFLNIPYKYERFKNEKIDKRVGCRRAHVRAGICD